VIAEALRDRGYADEAIAAIMEGNWRRVLNEHLPRQDGTAEERNTAY